MSPVAFDTLPPGANRIVSQWRHLASVDEQSPDFGPLLSSLTAQDTRSLTVKLCRADAKATLNIMDQVLRDGRIPREYTCDIVYTMRKLAYNSGQVPARYQVNRRSLSVETALIACGAFADVRKGKLGDKVVAIRTLRIDQQTDKDDSEKLFCKESTTWMNLSHPNILKLIGVDMDPGTGRYLMISEFMVNGNIKHYLRHNSANRHRLLEDAAAGLSYLHRCHVVHGDLKGNNILITNETPPQACLADFGLSIPTSTTPGATVTITAGGTPFYMAPELLSPKRFNKTSAQPTKPADIYAFGMVMLEVLTGFRPFYDKNWQIFEVFFHVMNGGRPTKPDDAEQIGLGDGTWELIEECWIEEPNDRPTIEKVLAHLTRVAASSGVVGPTPEIPRILPESDFSRTIMLPPQMTARSGDPTILTNQIPTAETIGTESQAGTANLFGTSSNYTLVSSMNSEDPDSDVELNTPYGLKTGSLPNSSDRKWRFHRSRIARKLLTKPENTLNSTIPMPLLFAKKPSTFDRLVSYGFFDDHRVKQGNAMGL